MARWQMVHGLLSARDEILERLAKKHASTPEELGPATPPRQHRASLFYSTLRVSSSGSRWDRGRISWLHRNRNPYNPWVHRSA